MVDSEASQVESVRRVGVRKRCACDGRIRSGARRGEALGSASGGFKARERWLVVSLPLGMPHVVRARPHRALAPRVEHVEAKRVVDTEAYEFPMLWWNRIVPLRSYVKGWKIGPSHYVNQDLANVWLDQQ